MAQGNQTPQGAEFIATARATDEVAITVRGHAKVRSRQLAALNQELLGNDKVYAAWRPSGHHIGIASFKDGKYLQLTLASRSGKLLAMHNLGAGRPSWLNWNCTGSALALMQEGTGIFLWDLAFLPNAPLDTINHSQSTQPLRLAPKITVDTTFCMWSKAHEQLAIGTSAGKVIIYNKQEGVMQLHDRKGKHGAAVTCGDWLHDNRLGLASGTRVKVSQPMPAQGAQWQSFSKFKLSGMLSRVPRRFKEARRRALLQRGSALRTQGGGHSLAGRRAQAALLLAAVPAVHRDVHRGELHAGLRHLGRGADQLRRGPHLARGLRPHHRLHVARGRCGARIASQRLRHQCRFRSYGARALCDMLVRIASTFSHMCRRSA